jgi:hypothetical protein
MHVELLGGALARHIREKTTRDGAIALAEQILAGGNAI